MLYSNPKGARPLHSHGKWNTYSRFYPSKGITAQRSRLRRRKLENDGFTITELTVVIVLIGIVTLVLYGIFNASLVNFLGLEKDSAQFNTIAQQSQRIATVVRGLTDITTADNNDMQFYTYFSPNDSYVSYIHYYLAGPNPTLYAEVTPMNGNPPTGTLLTAKKRTYTIIEKFNNQPSTPLFQYLDSVGTTLSQPIADLHAIKGVRINLSQKQDVKRLGDTYDSSLTVSLRNRKTNL